MSTVPDRVWSLTTAQLLLVAIVAIVGGVAGAFALGYGEAATDLLNSRALFPTLVAAFVLLMVLVDWRRR